MIPCYVCGEVPGQTTDGHACPCGRFRVVHQTGWTRRKNVWILHVRELDVVGRRTEANRKIAALRAEFGEWSGGRRVWAERQDRSWHEITDAPDGYVAEVADLAGVEEVLLT